MEFSLLCFWKLGNLKSWCCRTCIKPFLTMFSLVGRVREILRLSFNEGMHSRCELFSQQNHLPKGLYLKSSLWGSGFYNRTLECLKSQPITSMKITSSVGNSQVVHMLTEFIEYLISFSWTCILNYLHNHNRNGININVNMWSFAYIKFSINKCQKREKHTLILESSLENPDLFAPFDLWKPYYCWWNIATRRETRKMHYPTSHSCRVVGRRGKIIQMLCLKWQRLSLILSFPGSTLACS